MPEDKIKKGMLKGLMKVRNKKKKGPRRKDLGSGLLEDARSAIEKRRDALAQAAGTN